MRILDRYIIRKFLSTFFFVMALILSISVVFDVSEKVDTFIESGASVTEILFDYYLNFVIHFGNLFSALLIFISVIWFTSKMASNSEVVAILSSGVSFPRFLFPFFIAASIITLLSLTFNHYLVPRANETRLAFKNEYMGTSHWSSGDHLHRQIEPGKFVYFQRYRSKYQRGRRFTLEKWDEGKRELEYKLFAGRTEWDSASSKWELTNAALRYYGLEKDSLQSWSRLDTSFGFRPDDLGFKVSSAQSLTYTELNDRIEGEQDKGSEDVIHFRLEKHKRTSYPLATYVLTLIGVSIASRKVRGGLGLHIALGLLLAVTYIFFMKIFTVAATNAGLDPLAAVWIPNGVYLLIGLLIYYYAPK